jgi:hypothetical protein
MAGLSRPKDGVATLAYVPTIHASPIEEIEKRKAWVPRIKPGMTN